MEPIQIYVKEGETIQTLPKTPTHDSSINGLSPITNTSTTSFGACNFCHQILMLLSIKRQLIGEKNFNFTVHRVNLAKAPVEFRQNCLLNVPALVDPNTETSSDHEFEIVEYLDQQYPTPALLNTTVPHGGEELDVMKIGLELFKKFNNYIKNNTKEAYHLSQSLSSLNNFLEKKGLFENIFVFYHSKLKPTLYQRY